MGLFLSLQKEAEAEAEAEEGEEEVVTPAEGGEEVRIFMRSLLFFNDLINHLHAFLRGTFHSNEVK